MHSSINGNNIGKLRIYSVPGACINANDEFECLKGLTLPVSEHAGMVPLCTWEAGGPSSALKYKNNKKLLSVSQISSQNARYVGEIVYVCVCEGVCETLRVCAYV